MYPLGILFGLGFDTSSEVALLGIASIQAAKGTNIWLILIFPLLFTGESFLSFLPLISPLIHCIPSPSSLPRPKPPPQQQPTHPFSPPPTAGMALLDTLDSALMLTLYTTTLLAHDALATLYYSVVLTLLTVLVALVIGTLQLLALVLHVAEPRGRFWDGVERVGEHYDVVGGVICAVFVLGGVVGVVGYGRWRRWVERGRGVRRGEVELEVGEGAVEGGGGEGGGGGGGRVQMEMEGVRVGGEEKV